MKAIVVNEAGGPEKLIYTDVEKPKVKAGWSLVQVKGFGINHSEIFTRQGLSPSVTFPRILGIEAVGVIAETTDEAKLPIGQTVISIMGEMGRDFDGSYAEYVLLPNQQIYPVNTRLPWEILATIPETYFTAFGSMKRLNIKETDSILVRGATSGVGLAFLNLVKAQFPQIEICGTTRSLTKKEQLLKAGFDTVIEDRDGKLQTEASFDKIFELIGPATIKNSFQHLLLAGIICNTGLLGGKWYLEEFDPIMDTNGGYLTGFYSGDVSSQKLNQLLDYIEEFRVTIQPEKVFKLSEVRLAHEYLESQKSFGKTIILN
ncbi:zinc-binding dehydrogenase [Enterococcus sp. AZ103]|uniref:zinc-binding dehydrogenase n=1 Tax=Enterococcus sp. AZ103 TaxID=2774628 RepID=UPI003F201F2D